MKKVYIITEEGRTYSDEGLEYITNEIRNGTFTDSDELSFFMGQEYNKPDVLSGLIEKNIENTYVVISGTTGMFFFDPDKVGQLIEVLRKYPDMTSWESMHGAAMNQLHYLQEKGEY